MGSEGRKTKLFASGNHEFPNEMGGTEFPDTEINVVRREVNDRYEINGI